MNNDTKFKIESNLEFIDFCKCLYGDKKSMLTLLPNGQLINVYNISHINIKEKRYNR